MCYLDKELEDLNFRTDIPSWDEYFIGLTKYVATRSKDPKTQVGACIVDKNKRILSLGYNGMPLGIPDDIEHWQKKHLYVSHAEANAISFCKGDMEGSTLYVTFFPCNECAKRIIQNKIKKIVYLEKKESKNIPSNISEEMFKEVGIEVEKYTPTGREFNIQV